MTDPAMIDAANVSLGQGSEIGLAIALAVMMFAVALSLRVSDFAFLRTHPKMFVGGVITQVLGLPLVTLALAALIAPTPSVALGMIVVACCPGGNVSNLFVMLARGNVAYSVALTGVSSALAFLVTPLSILFWASLYPPTAELIHQVDVDPLPFLVQVAAMLAVPLALGMLVRAKLPKLADRLQPIFQGLAILIIIALIAVGLQGNWAIVMATGLIIVPVAVIHNATAFSLGAASGRVLQLDPPSRRALTFEIGIQNSGLGLVILLAQFDGLGGAAAVTATWAIWHLVAGLSLATAFRVWNARRAASGSTAE